MRKIILFVVAVAVLSACSSEVELKAGDGVLVDWAQDAYAWHNASLVSECEGGWAVDFVDNFYDSEKGSEVRCYPFKDIVPDFVPEIKDVKAGDKVYAEWGGSYYGATVKEIKDSKFLLKYDDDYEDEVELAKIRLNLQEKLK